MPSDHYAEFEQTDETYVAVLDGVEVARSSEVVLLKEHYKQEDIWEAIRRFFTQQATQKD